MDFDDPKAFWNHQAATPEGARLAVDGSGDERTLQLTGAFSAAQARAALDPQPRDRIFELGCGVGRIGRELVGEVALWHGVDISENMLAVARERLADAGNARFDVLDGPRLPMLADASFDKGYCVAVFIHMDKEDMVLFLREVARVLRPGGLFYFDHWNLAHPVGWKRFSAEVDEIGRRGPGRRKDVARNQFCVPQELEAYVRGAGLEPLLVIADTPNAQVVCRKPDGDAAAAARETARLRDAAPRIDYGPQWTAYFEAIVDAEAAGQPPQRLRELLAAAPAGDATAAMFRAWIAGLWRLRAARWGELPADLQEPKQE
ncbi:class I SAM-dependent methyltransferase [Arenimonas composti]|uniref:Methyltransferase domain-containing protein n=1 Tax=Arenimonas composti TR7-09 = DSM 18010 TaxID=1121013 RepID=A0A091C1X2_9GAMM|nr:class I SAM-dependent methyltransferase [Arenimonas composti]KFN50640.1 hypothetical protein P873_05625 [Arenimonas composti TR7-09 = DSM 18010]